MWCIYVRFDNITASFPIFNIHTGLWYYLPLSSSSSLMTTLTSFLASNITTLNRIAMNITCTIDIHTQKVENNVPKTTELNGDSTLRLTYAIWTKTTNCVSILLLLLLSPAISLSLSFVRSLSRLLSEIVQMCTTQHASTFFSLLFIIRMVTHISEVSERIQCFCVHTHKQSNRTHMNTRYPFLSILSHTLLEIESSKS